MLQSSVLVNINSLSHELWTLIDITERKQAELDLKKINNDLDKKVKERTKELSEMLEKEKNTSDQKSRFISTASHEFRTPLTTILMSAGLLENYAKTSEIDKCEKHIRRIRSSVKLLVEILDYFLSLDKLEQGKIDINISSFDFKAFADDVINYAGEWLKEGQTIVLSMVGDNMINQDKALLRGIMFHLLSNASKYSAEGAKISVSVTVKRNPLFMNVSDKGIGIPANDQPYIFSRFFRAKNAELIQGTGLGLSIVNNYVKLLHGSIYFKSVENEGTAFAIELPIGKK